MKYQLLQAVRHQLCRLLAVGLIVSGRVSRARRRVLITNSITAIYFHNPPKHLFVECVRWLRRHGYTFVSTEELRSILDKETPVPSGAVWITLDDGWRQNLANIIPTVRGANIPITIFVCSGIVAGIGRFSWVTAGRSHDPHARDCITLQELMQISALRQVTIGAHTVNHTVTTSCDAQHVRREVQLDKTSLERYTGRSISAFAYPCGQWTERDKAIIKAAGFALAATTANEFITVNTDPFLLPRLSIADGISVQEAICNMVGIWSPFINSVKSLFPNCLANDGAHS